MRTILFFEKSKSLFKLKVTNKLPFSFSKSIFLTCPIAYPFMVTGAETASPATLL
jgi:hypothetical protein